MQSRGSPILWKPIPTHFTASPRWIRRHFTKSTKSPQTPKEGSFSMTKKFDEEDRKQQRLRRLGTQNPRCVVCGESDPAVLDLHHIAGRKHSDDVSIVCANHHRKLSD